MLHRVGLYLEPHNACAGESVRAMILDNEAQVVVDVRLPWIGARDVLRTDEAEAEASVVHVLLCAVWHFRDHLGRRWQIIHNHVHAVVLPHALRKADTMAPFQLHTARNSELGLAHVDIVRRVLDDGAVQHLPQVLRLLHDFRRPAEGQAVVVVRQVCAWRGELVHPDLHALIILVLARRDPRQVEASHECGKGEQQQPAHGEAVSVSANGTSACC
mmetsp:Transcript_27964/g.65302  ORF Transcript_27964/g.65302 Transcript_27964/m.65302 type:complete len:216 (-) Transcript_27964:31-678(-)